jgi:hypothetical protein
MDLQRLVRHIERGFSRVEFGDGPSFLAVSPRASARAACRTRSREAASLTAMSAILKLTPSKSLIGRPNCCLVDVYLTACSKDERAIPIIPAATAGRSLSSSSRIIEKPRLRSSTRFSPGTPTFRSRRWATLAPLMPRRL